MVRERPAGLFYSTRVQSGAVHVVDQALDLAAGAGATNLIRVFPLPQGVPEGRLPDGPFALASPLAGWASKQWPLEYYERLATMLQQKLGLALVLNGPPGTVPAVTGTLVHESGIPGLIDATRRAALVIGVDSGPLHLAAASEQIGRCGLWPDRSGAQRSLRRGFPGLPYARRAHHAPARHDDRRIDAGDHTGAGLYRAGFPSPLSRGQLGSMRRHWFPKRYADTVARLRVTAGFVMVAAFAWFSHPDTLSLAIGLPALRLWARTARLGRRTP